jgi:3-phosphoshikimate 1-carboxyvinyltransferase
MIITFKENTFSSYEIDLVSSKSLSNRALIIQALCKETIIISNLSEASDTQILLNNLYSNKTQKDIGMAGTAARFLAAYLATKTEGFELTGHARMQERPMKALFQSLEILGCKIEYLEKKYFLPVKINGRKMLGGEISLDAQVSSQFTSALMMIAPKLPNGLTISLQNKIVSAPYIFMTKKMMEYFGVPVTIHENIIQIAAQSYQAKNISIESDWSSASYFYSALALLDKGTMVLKNLSNASWQGDQLLAEIYYSLGIITSFQDEDVLIEKTNQSVHHFTYNFEDCPDLAQTVIATCIGLGIEGEFTGLTTLIHKETNRIVAMQNEIIQFGYELVSLDNVHYKLQKKQLIKPSKKIVKTYNDHRMAMAFAPLAIVYGDIEIENEDVVNKSFPRFWMEFSKIGIQDARISTQ